MKKLLSLVSVIALCLTLTSCGKEETKKEEVKEPEVLETTHKFVDDLGREIEIKNDLTKIAPSGGMAQIVLYTIAPNLMVSNATAYVDGAAPYILDEVENLPVTGQYYGKNANLNIEKLMSLGCELILDCGEVKGNIKEDLDNLQEQCGIPVVFVEYQFENTDRLYERFAEALGLDLSKQIAYAKDTLNYFNENRSNITEPKKVYMALGDDGLHTNGEGTMHSEVLEFVGGDNVADIKGTSKGMGVEVSFESILNWNPEIIVCDNALAYEEVTTNEMWRVIDAVKNDKVYLTPDLPYNYISRPPSVNRLIGVYYLADILYPEVYDIDFEAKEQEFFDLFYHCDLASVRK